MTEKHIWSNGCGFCLIVGLLGGPGFESSLVQFVQQLLCQLNSVGFCVAKTDISCSETT